MEVVRARAEERGRVVREAREWAQRLNYRSAIVLVGSYARGDFNKWSGVDILVVTDEISGSPLERLRKIIIPPGYDIVVWTLNEFKTMLKKKNPLAAEVVETGVLLRDDYGVAEELPRRSRVPRGTPLPYVGRN